ncbi:MAG: hypothetical protein AAFY56_08740 [Pseudomonadota bacterium]
MLRRDLIELAVGEFTAEIGLEEFTKSLANSGFMAWLLERVEGSPAQEHA